MTSRIAVLANPHAGKGRARAAIDQAVARLEERGAEVRVYEGASAQESSKLVAQALLDQPTVLVVIGGDGTLAGILDQVIAADIPIALIPAGTGNDFARALELPRHDGEAAADLALDGTPRRIDVGEVHSNDGSVTFLTVAALGFDAKVSDRTNQLRWPRGALRYYLAILIELARLRPMRFSVAIDAGDEVVSPSTLIAVGNTSSYGGGMPVCVGARPDDGLLDVVQVVPLTRLRLLRLFPLLLRGRHLSRPEVEHRHARTVAVSAPELVVYADGEPVARGSCTISVRPRALTVLVPERGVRDD